MVHESRLFPFEMEPCYVIEVNFELMGSKIFLSQLGLQANATMPSHEQRILQNVYRLRIVWLSGREHWSIM